MIKKVEHVALIVNDMDKTIHYYESLFGFKLRVRGENSRREMAFLRHSQMTDMELELMRDLVPNNGYSNQGIVNHLAFTVENMDEAISFYREKGVVFLTETPNIAIDGAKTIFFNGPNKELLQLVEPKGEY